MDVSGGDRRLAFGLVASLLLHALVLAWIRVPWHSSAPLQALLPIEVEVPPAPVAKPAVRTVPEPPPAAAETAKEEEKAENPPDLRLPERQIVAPPDAGEERAPEQARLLSDRDNRVQEETVRRAEQYREKSAADVPPAQRRPRAATNDTNTARQRADLRPDAVERREQVAALPKLDRLLPRLGEMPVAVAPEPTPGSGASTSGTAGRRFLLGSAGPAFSVQPGTADFLPGIREGNITLLNTKAERFAPFVRRVATRVFQHLDIRLRQTARAGSASPGREYAVVEAVMDRHGQLVRARVVERQSTSTFGADRVLLSVTTPETFFDANPPPGAEASDGNIHFLLLIDLDVVAVPDPRTGRVAVGYRGIAGVGLDALAERGR